jgi:hypothetical protein
VLRRRPAKVTTNPLIEHASRPGAKGRPTPKRNATAPSRMTVRPPKDRKEAARLAKARDRQDREKKRKAYLSGDPRALPARDAGPVRGFVRDYIDSRRTVGEFLMPVMAFVFVFSLLPLGSLKVYSVLALYVVILIAAIDSYLLNRRLKRELASRFPSEATKGLTVYALVRALQFRKLRTPKPRVQPGAVL